jgi:hypothetical protein
MASYLDETIVIPHLRVAGGAPAPTLRQGEIVLVECPEQPDRGPTVTLTGLRGQPARASLSLGAPTELAR